MTNSTLSMDVRKVSDRTSVVDIAGDVTGASEATMMDAYNQATSDSTRAIVLNFSSLEYMNSGGIGLLVTLLVRANRQGQQLFACGLNEHYRQIFELTRLDDAIGIYNNESDALGAAG